MFSHKMTIKSGNNFDQKFGSDNMVNIAIIDKNEIFSDSLKIMLEQVADFNVNVYKTEFGLDRDESGFVPDVLLLDAEFGTNRSKEVLEKENGAVWQKKTLMMVMFKDDFSFDSFNFPMILKSSSAKDFENKVRELASKLNEHKNPEI